MIKFSFSAIFLIGLNLLCSCVVDYSNSMLKVHNSSDKKITILYSNVEPPPPTQNEIAFYVSEGQAIAPDSINTIFRAGKPDAWHRYIEKGFDKRLFVYVFDVDTLVGYNGIYTMNELISMHKY